MISPLPSGEVSTKPGQLQMGINGGLCFGPDTPFGGYKQSGIGRENGRESFEEYLQTKSIGIPATK